LRRVEEFEVVFAAISESGHFLRKHYEPNFGRFGQHASASPVEVDGIFYASRRYFDNGGRRVDQTSGAAIVKLRYPTPICEPSPKLESGTERRTCPIVSRRDVEKIVISFSRVAYVPPKPYNTGPSAVFDLPMLAENSNERKEGSVS